MARRTIVMAAAAGALLAGGGVAAVKARDDALQAEATGARIMETARAIVAVGPATQGTPNKARVEALIVERLEGTGAWVRRLPFRVKMDDVGLDWSLVNVVASFRKEAKHRLMIGVHWDIRPWADEDPDPAKRHLPFEGANDGVSGVAVLLELARSLAATAPPEGVGVDLVFFDGEEGPKGHIHHHFLGSKELAERWFTTGVAPPAKGVVLDMVGRKGTRIRREGISQQQAGAVLDEIFALAKARGARSFVDAPGPQVLDDHIAFLKRGIPVVDLIDLDDPAWHTHGDTIDRLDPAVVAEVHDVVLAWVQAQRAP
ncbi:MAG TPA: M28 family peptidase [Vulgatibacter sp.]|nr:M28 family peptidase [Vulgatibacter sp.]